MPALEHTQRTFNFSSTTQDIFPPEASTERSVPILATQKPARSPKFMDIDNIIGPQSHSSPSPPPNGTDEMTEPSNCRSVLVGDMHISPSSPSQPLSHRHSPSPTKSLSPPIDSYGAREPHEMEASIEPPRKSWKHATGIRRGIRVDNMISVDAPTHYRRPPGSIAPYNTSTWALPKGGSPTSDTHSAPRLHRSALSPLQLPQHSRLYDDSLDDEVGLGSAESDDQKYLITAEDGELVSVADSPEARKRRQNTVAARRSRQRKLEYVRSLETQVAELQSERDGLRTRCQKAEEKVQWLKEMLMDGRRSS